MLKDNNIGESFIGTQNPWIKRLGLYIIIVGVFADFFKQHIILFFFILFGIIGLAILRVIGVGIVQVFKDLFFK